MISSNKSKFFLLFVLLNLILYSWLILFNNLIPFNKFNYFNNFHHYQIDPRIDGRSFDFLIGLGQADAQWYLKIANEGYPRNPHLTDQEDKFKLDGLTYAFFPLYPLIAGLINQVIKNVSISAFIISNTFIIVNFFSLYFVITKLFSKDIALRTIFLIFLFPFSIFFRSYFTEGLFLLLFIWFSYFLINKKFLYSAAFLGLLTITRPNGLFLIPVFLFFIFKELRHKKLPLKIALIANTISFIPFVIWLYFNFLNTGNLFYFYSVQEEWFKSSDIFRTFLYNLKALLNFGNLAFHLFHESKIDSLMGLVSVFLLFLSKKFLPLELWLSSFALSIIPLLTKDTMSYSRYITVIFPFFVFLAFKLKGVGYGVVIGIFSTLLFITALYFINWYWIG